MGKYWKDKMRKQGRLFKIFITEPGAVTSKVPFTIDAQLYGEHSFYIHGIHYIKSSKDFANADRSIRRCNFPWEGNLTQFESYSQANCLLECKLLNISEQCGCSSWFLRQNDRPICDYSKKQRDCYIKTNEYFMDGICPCPSDCEMVHFFSGMGIEKYDSVDDFHSYEWINPQNGRLRHYILDERNLHSTDIYRRLTRLSHGVESDEEFVIERFKKDVAIVHFFFDTPVITQITTEMRLTVFDQISSIGGTLGLCTGVSIISFFEVMYWILKFTRSQFLRLANGVSHINRKQINECYILDDSNSIIK
ncbi:ASICN [Lepeophtheirus salmonis]|uniref:ASICN n=2 Tax=Lepeophtheirus salmonis TaxID=72036 RepID=A0A7R8H9W4_LEPSM|nr:ASICN [Lepeophtheirus salmonis]CAF2961815.1 ASICN [Lepeophtheirus salmonis]